jgi:phosphohistidine phosphatase
MKTLTLVRHAKSSWQDSGLSDRERPLNERGERDAPMMGTRVVEAGIRPSQIISSPAVRAWATAKVFSKALNYPIEFLQREDGLYLASLDNLLDTIATQDPGFNNLMLFAHNPGLTDLANYLIPGLTNNLPTCGVVSVNIECDDWMLYDRPNIELVVYDYPKKI